MNYFEGVDTKTMNAFMEYHRANRWVWEEFERRARELKAQGRTRIAAKEIFEAMRYEARANERGEEFKLNNNWAPYYARALVQKHAEFRGLVELREARGVRAA